MPCDPHLAEKILATGADILMLWGAILLAREAFAREKDIDQVAADLTALLNPVLSDFEFILEGTVIRPADKRIKEKLEKINARQSRKKSLWPGIMLTGVGFLLHIVSLWV